MAEKRAKKSELEKFSGFAELATKKMEYIKEEEWLNKSLEDLKRRKVETCTIEKVGEKPIEPKDVTPTLKPMVFVVIALGVLLIVAPIILFIIAVNMQSTSVDSDPMGLYTIVFLLIVAAFIFVPRCFESVGYELEVYKKDVDTHNEYPTKKYQYDVALKKWNGEYEKNKKERDSLIAQYKKELEDVSAHLLEVGNAINEGYKDLEAIFFESAGCAGDEEIEKIQMKFKDKKKFLLGVYSYHRENEYLLSNCDGYSEYGELFKAYIYESREKKDFFCEPLVGLMKKKLSESKRGTIIGCANKIIDGLDALVLEWQRKSCDKKNKEMEEKRRWRLCESCWNFKGGRCPMAPKEDCGSYIANDD